jgi:hypothetical protein
VGLTSDIGIAGLAKVDNVNSETHSSPVIEYSQGSVYIVVSGHDESTANLVKLVPAHGCSTVCRVCVCADAHAELPVALQRYVSIAPHTLKRNLTI